MINITFYVRPDNSVTGFDSKGHAGYEDSGKDIICAAVSVLVINMINSVDEFTDDHYSFDVDDKNATIKFRFCDDCISDKSTVLSDSLRLGLKQIAADHPEYVSIRFEEV